MNLLKTNGVSQVASRHAKLHNEHMAEYSKHKQSHQNAPAGSAAEAYHRQKAMHNKKMMEHHAKLYHAEIANPSKLKTASQNASRYEPTFAPKGQRVKSMPLISSFGEAIFSLVEAREKPSLNKKNIALLIKHQDAIKHHKAECLDCRPGSSKFAHHAAKVVYHRTMAEHHAGNVKNTVLSGFNVEAKVFDSSRYDWYIFTAVKPKIILDAKKKHQVVLRKGSVFGLRQATSDKNKFRMISPEYGASIVFSLTLEKAEELKNNSKPTKAPI